MNSDIRGIQFDFPSNQVVVVANLDGHPGTFLIDTGTSPSAIDYSFATGLGLQFNPKSAEGTERENNDVSFPEAIIPLITMGEMRREMISALAVDLSEISSRLGRHLSGVLGFSFLKRGPFEIDYRRHVISFPSEIPTFRLGSSRHGDIFKMQLVGEVPSIEELRIDGKTVRVIIDTGSSRGLVLFPAGVRYLDLEEQVSAWAQTVIYRYQGEGRANKGILNKVELGSYLFDQLEATYEPHWTQGTDTTTNDGTIHGSLGNGLLKEFVVGLDYSAKKMVLSTV